MGEKIQGEALKVLILVLSTLLKKKTELFRVLPLPGTVKSDICISSSFPQLNWLVSLHFFFHSARSNPLMQVPCSQNTASFWGLWPTLSYCLKAWFWNTHYGKARFNLLPGGLAGGSGGFKGWQAIYGLPIFQQICALSEYRKTFLNFYLGFWKMLSLNWPHLVYWFSGWIQIHRGTDLLRLFLKPTSFEQMWVAEHCEV